MNLESLVVNITRDNGRAIWKATIDGIPEAVGVGGNPDDALKHLWSKSLGIVAKGSGSEHTRKALEQIVRQPADYSRIVSQDQIVAEWKLPV
jgi:hypothetical protein